MKAKRRTKRLILKAKGQPRSCSRCRGTKAAFESVRHCDEAVVTPESEIYLTHRSVRFYDCCVAVAHQTDRSLRTSAAATEAHTYANRPAGRPPRGAVLLICQPSREAEWRFCGVGRPAWMPGEPRWAMDGPWRRAHGAEPERGNLSEAKSVRWGDDYLVPFWSFKKGLAVRAKPIFQLDTNAGYVRGGSVV